MRYSMKAKMLALDELIKRLILFTDKDIVAYSFDGREYYYNNRLNWSMEEQREYLDQSITVVCTVETTWYQKKAARKILELIAGKEKSKDLIELKAIVTDRNDPLVSRWRRKVISRDKKCRHCGKTGQLHAHHISHWSDDPINRINVNNGIALCCGCHALEHPEIERLILSRGDDYGSRS